MASKSLDQKRWDALDNYSFNYGYLSGLLTRKRELFTQSEWKEIQDTLIKIQKANNTLTWGEQKL